MDALQPYEESIAGATGCLPFGFPVLILKVSKTSELVFSLRYHRLPDLSAQSAHLLTFLYRWIYIKSRKKMDKRKQPK